MSEEQGAIVLILAATMGLFLWGRWRHDLVGMAALLACVVAGLVPAAEAFNGFGHPAVVTVACILILSNALMETGIVDAATRKLLPQGAGTVTTIAALTLTAAVLSAFMNNVGALALLMPIALQLAARQNVPPGRLLMPLAFGSILGGMTTLIGTPPNLIVAGFRAQASGEAFTMFDFSAVGLAVAGGGLLFLVLIGWRLVPGRERTDAASFETAAYFTEVRVPEDGKLVGQRLFEIEATMEEAGAQIVGLVRNDVRLRVPYRGRRTRAGDILVIEAEPDRLAEILSALDLQLVEAEGTPAAVDPKEGEPDEDRAAAIDLALSEFAVLPTSRLPGRTAAETQLRRRYGINLLAVSRQGARSVARLRHMRLKAGDVLLMQGSPDALGAFASDFGCVPLAERPLHLPDKRRAVTALAIMAAAVGAAAVGLMSAAVCFAAGVAAAAVLGVVSPRRLYNAVDWPVVVMLAALIPVAGAMAATGTADLVAVILLDHLAQGHAAVALALILVVTMTLSDFMNNAATAAVMCPVAIGGAAQLGVSADPFLMAVAVGASCAFLTPIGHQNNTLILGPGGFRFGDYWRLGLPVELIVVAVGVPMILLVWPL